MIKRLLLNDIKRCIKIEVLGIILLITVCLLYEENATTSPIEWASKLGSNTLFLVLSITIAMIPGIYQYIDDKEYGFCNEIKYRTSTDVYCYVKILISYFSSSTVWLLGFIISFIYKIICYRNNVIDELIYDNSFLSISIIQLSAFVGVMSLTGLLLASLTKNGLISIIVPTMILKAEDLLAYVICSNKNTDFSAFSFYMIFIGSLEVDAFRYSLEVKLLVIILLFILFSSVFYLIETGNDK